MRLELNSHCTWVGQQSITAAISRLSRALVEAIFQSYCKWNELAIRKTIFYHIFRCTIIQFTYFEAFCLVGIGFNKALYTFMNPFLQLSASSTRQQLVTNYAVCVCVKTFCGKTNDMSDCNVYISSTVPSSCYPAPSLEPIFGQYLGSGGSTDDQMMCVNEGWCPAFE